MFKLYPYAYPFDSNDRAGSQPVGGRRRRRAGRRPPDRGSGREGSARRREAQRAPFHRGADSNLRNPRAAVPRRGARRGTGGAVPAIGPSGCPDRQGREHCRGASGRGRASQPAVSGAPRCKFNNYHKYVPDNLRFLEEKYTETFKI